MMAECSTTLDAEAAYRIVEAVYMAWNRGDLEGLLDQYVDDLTFWSNVGGADGKPITIVGKPAFRTFITGIADESNSTSIMRHFWFRDGVARAKIDYCLQHKKTDATLSGSYRQLTFFRDGKIARVEQYHDAARTAAFWRLADDETESG